MRVLRLARPASLRIGEAGAFVHDRLNGVLLCTSAFFHMLASRLQFVKRRAFLYAVRALVVAGLADVVHLRRKNRRRRVFFERLAKRRVLRSR